MSIALLPNSLLAQYLWVQFTGSLISCYVVHKQPFTTKFANRTVVLEELTIIVLVYHIICFSQWISDPGVRHNLGISFITIVSSILFIFHFFSLKQRLIAKLK